MSGQQHDSSDAEWRAKLQGFMDWCRVLGVPLGKLRLETSSGRGLGVFTDAAIGADEVALTIPLEAVLTVSRAVRSDVGQAVLGSQVFHGERISSQALIYLVMIDGRERAESCWHPWLQLLPATFSDPLWWERCERDRLLAGTQLAFEAARHESILQDVYSGLFPALSDELPGVFPSARFTIDAFRWARSALSSRSFSLAALETLLPVAGGNVSAVAVPDSFKLTPQEESRLRPDCPAMLCPLLDFTNHCADTTVHVGLAEAGGGRPPMHLGLRVVGGVPAGAEVPNNYGACRSNLQLLLGYGFALPGNAADTLPLKLGASPAVSASTVKQQALERAGLQPEQVHELSLSKPLPAALLALLRVMVMTEKALMKRAKAAGVGALRKVSGELPTGAADAFLAALCEPLPPCVRGGCELDVLGALRQQLLRKKQLLEAVRLDPERTQNERHASHYRRGQMDIAAAALAAVDKAEGDWRQKYGIGRENAEGEEEKEKQEVKGASEPTPQGSPAKRARQGDVQ